MGAGASERRSAEEEKRMGESFMRQVRQALPVSDDPELEDYIQNLGFRLVSHGEQHERPFNFFIVNESSINAFAGPGGYIGMHAGLILATESESELAAVLAHEIAHVSQRHLDRAMDAADKLSIPTAGAIIAALILGSRDVLLAEAAIAATLAASIQKQLNFTRAHEQEADHIGIRTLASAGYDTRAMSQFFERLQQNDQLYNNELPEFLRTHPVTTQRIAESRSRADRHPPPGLPDQQLYHLMRAKLRVLAAKDPARLVQSYEASLKEGRHQNLFAARYGYALALAKQGRYNRARDELENLIRDDRERITYAVALAQIYADEGSTSTALHIYRDALSLTPGNSTLTRLYANALIAGGEAEQARAVLQAYIGRNAESPQAWQLLAKAWGVLDKPVEAHRALAELYYLRGQTRFAVSHLQLALQQKAIPFDEKERIEGRLKELKLIALEEQQLYGQP
ncbi:MAG: M48 family metalloprotease [Nitrospira sp.]|nr:M48 family metalloprotease [Nitrospira sp.]